MLACTSAGVAACLVVVHLVGECLGEEPLEEEAEVHLLLPQIPRAMGEA